MVTLEPNPHPNNRAGPDRARSRRLSVTKARGRLGHHGSRSASRGPLRRPDRYIPAVSSSVVRAAGAAVASFGPARGGSGRGLRASSPRDQRGPAQPAQPAQPSAIAYELMRPARSDADPCRAGLTLVLSTARLGRAAGSTSLFGYAVQHQAGMAQSADGGRSTGCLAWLTHGTWRRRPRSAEADVFPWQCHGSGPTPPGSDRTHESMLAFRAILHRGRSWSLHS